MLKPFTIHPNTCFNCGAGPLTEVYAPNQDQANAGAGLCANCAGVAPKEAAPEPPPGKPITEMTKAELLAVAQGMGITTTDSMNKAQLLDLIAAGS